MDTNKKIAEPFPLFGDIAVINSKKQARQVLKENSYYFFIAGLFQLSMYTLTVFSPNNGKDMSIMLFFGLIDLIIGFFIRVMQSRVASLVALLIYLSTIITRFPEVGFSWPFIFILILLAASYRSVKASFYFYKKQ